MQPQNYKFSQSTICRPSLWARLLPSDMIMPVLLLNLSVIFQREECFLLSLVLHSIPKNEIFFFCNIDPGYHCTMATSRAKPSCFKDFCVSFLVLPSWIPSTLGKRNYTHRHETRLSQYPKRLCIQLNPLLAQRPVASTLPHRVRPMQDQLVVDRKSVV